MRSSCRTCTSSGEPGKSQLGKKLVWWPWEFIFRRPVCAPSAPLQNVTPDLLSAISCRAARFWGSASNSAYRVFGKTCMHSLVQRPSEAPTSMTVAGFTPSDLMRSKQIAKPMGPQSAPTSRAPRGRARRFVALISSRMRLAPPLPRSVPSPPARTEGSARTTTRRAIETPAPQHWPERRRSRP